MAKKPTLDPREISKFLGHTGQVFAIRIVNFRIKPQDRAADFAQAIALGLFWAKRQPEISDACSLWWNSTQKPTSDKYVDTILGAYHEIVDIDSKRT